MNNNKLDNTQHGSNNLNVKNNNLDSMNSAKKGLFVFILFCITAFAYMGIAVYTQFFTTNPDRVKVAVNAGLSLMWVIVGFGLMMRYRRSR